MTRIAETIQAAPVNSRTLPTIPALTGLRFVAAFTVAVEHGVATSFPLVGGPYVAQHWIETLGGPGMTLFFVLSGFVIHYNYRVMIFSRGIKGVMEFLWARFARLYPLFLLIILADILLESGVEAIINFDGRSSLATLQSLPYFLTFTQSWVYHVFGLHSLIYQIGYDAPLTWSISTEWFFYAVYPGILLVLACSRRAAHSIALTFGWCITWLALIYIANSYQPEMNAWAVGHFGSVADINTSVADSFIRWLFYFSPYARIGEFILGCLVAQVCNQLSHVPVSRREKELAPVAVGIAITSIPVLLYYMYAPGGSSIMRTWNNNFGSAPTIGIILFCCVRYDLWIVRLLSAPIAVRLGEASYSIYMIHMLVYMIGSQTSGYLHAVTPWSVTVLSLRLAFMLFVILLLSVGLHAVYEAPARSWLRNLRLRRGWAGVVCVSGAVAVAAGSFALGAERITSYRAADAISIVTASYGANCGVAPGNITGMAKQICNGLQSCDFVVDYQKIGDVAPGCGKAFDAEYLCPKSGTHSVSIPGEAGYRSVAKMSCAREGQYIAK